MNQIKYNKYNLQFQDKLKSKKGVNVAQLTDALSKKDNDVRTKERMLQQLRTSHMALEQEYHKIMDSFPKLQVCAFIFVYTCIIKCDIILCCFLLNYVSIN